MRVLPGHDPSGESAPGVRFLGSVGSMPPARWLVGGIWPSLGPFGRDPEQGTVHRTKRKTRSFVISYFACVACSLDVDLLAETWELWSISVGLKTIPD